MVHFDPTSPITRGKTGAVGCCLLALLVAGWPSFALARTGRAINVDPAMFLPLIMALGLAPLVGLQIAETGKYDPKAPWFAGFAVLVTLALSASLVRFGPFVTPILQIAILTLVLRRACVKRTAAETNDPGRSPERRS
jgi:hypothetical protein